MDRILVIEDNKTLANLMAKKISSKLDFEVDVAYSMSEAKLFLKGYKYFLTLSDLNLPDAPNGEIIDYVLKTGNHVIILTSNIDKSFRKKMFEKNIIDYIHKTGIEDINYIINNIRRLSKNRKHKVLVVDDSVVFRKQMKDMLTNLFFNVITVAHGEEAINILDTTPDISLVLTDYNMPVMNGLELTTQIRKKYKKSELCIIALSGKSDDEEIAMFLKSGANDFIKKPFSKEEFSCRINNSIEALENIHAITNQSIRDFLTGLYNRRYFFKEVEKYFIDAVNNDESFSIAMVDIDDLKKINDTYGHENGDKIIVSLAETLRSETSKDDIVARFGAGEFCMVLKDVSTDKAIDALESIRQKVQNSVTLSDKNQEIKYTISVGIALEHENTLEDTVNEADMHLYTAKENGKNKIEHQ
ncbi:diguanylate cyclase [Sulfurimonas lithotrophica]|uniref:diguanylate cyclase n=1 Tax=Sulfurimonas lithotrophica TaxID=2590022 RepID=A0A5P8NXP6_9BACT|nr:response regulator [Sulfurimonas lithotrophica]QFR48192.1 diguanylate cyclase [Sulfurimonas lithotrophica]